MSNIIWEPQPGPQTALVTCPVFEIFYGGARGGGKTDGSLGDWLIHQNLYGPHAIGLFVRRNLTQLHEVIARSKELFKPIGATYREKQSEWQFQNGARLKFAYLERDVDAENYMGHSYTRVYIEEAGNFPSPVPIDKLKATLRSVHHVPVGMRLTGNPGGPGHLWLKARYIDPNPTGYKVFYQTEIVNGKEIKLGRTFIPAKLSDNKKLTESNPAYQLQLKQSGSAQLVKAWLDGDWSAILGAFFDTLSPQNNGFPASLKIPAHWTRFRAFDWGSSAPFSVGWYAVSDGTLEGIPINTLLRYREWYGWNGTPNTGLKLSASAVAEGILNRERGETINFSVADPSIYIRNGGPSIAESMMIKGVHFLKADNSRETGWAKMRELIVDKKLLISSACTQFWRTVPALQHLENNQEELNTKAEDHVGDEVRYACMARYYVSKQAIKLSSTQWSFKHLEESYDAKRKRTKY